MIYLKSNTGKRKKYVKASTLRDKNVDIFQYFEPSCFDKYTSSTTKNERLYFVSIDHFLQLAKSGFDSGKERTVQLLLRDKIPLSSLPYLKVSQKNKSEWVVTAHEGRHRARAFASAGFTHIPVVIKHDTVDISKSFTAPTYVWAQVPKKDALLFLDVFK